MEKFVKVNPTPGPDHGVAEQLVKIGQTDLEKSVRILDMVLHAAQATWQVNDWAEAVRVILKPALKVSGETSDCARNLINYLGRRGHTSLGKLLEE